MSETLSLPEPSKSACLGRAEMLTGVRRIWNMSVLAVYPRPGEPNIIHPIFDPRATMNHNDDGSISYGFRDGLWSLRRVFLGGGISEFDGIESFGQFCAEQVIVKYRKKIVWVMSSWGTVGSELQGGKLIDVLMMLFRESVEENTEIWRRTLPRHPKNCVNKLSVSDQCGGLGHFAGTERIYSESNAVSYIGEFGGCLIE